MRGCIPGLLLVSAFALLVACGGDPRPLPDAPAGVAGATLQSVGGTLVWIGGISAAIGVAFRLISLVYLPLAGLGSLFGFLALGGLGVTATGSSLQWLSDNPIVMVLVIVASVGSLVWWYWPSIRRRLDRRLAGKT